MKSKALLSTEENKKITSKITDVPTPEIKSGEVLIRSAYSGLNFKDALGVTGKGRIFKSFPMIGGIDVAGEVIESKDAKFKIGDQVLITGCNLGETHNGGFAECISENSESVVRCPKNLTPKESMIYGTAGFTAALCVERMLQNDQRPDMGPILVTGASGGVGQFAVAFFAKLGFEVHAVSSKKDLASRFKEIGAKKLIDAKELEAQFQSTKPLEGVAYGGAVDNVGGALLTGILARVQLWGNVASVGLASSHELHSTVMPHILRGVNLLGISSNNTARPLREKIWTRLAGDLKPSNLESFISNTITPNEILKTAQAMLERKTFGRTLIDLSQF